LSHARKFSSLPVLGSEVEALFSGWTALTRGDRGWAAVWTDELETCHVLTLSSWTCWRRWGCWWRRRWRRWRTQCLVGTAGAGRNRSQLAVMTEDGDTLFALTVRLLLAEIIAGYFLARLVSQVALCEAGTAATWRWRSDGAVRASLQKTSHQTTVSDGALAGPRTALRPGDGSQGPVITHLRDAGLRVTVSHRAEPGVRAAVTRSHWGQVSVRTESRAKTLLLRTGETQTVLTEVRVRTAVTRRYRSHRAVPAVINPAVPCCPTVPGTEQTAGTTSARRGGWD